MFDFAEKTKDMTALEILNYYRNLYYAEPQVTERGIVANAINDVIADLAPRGEVVKAKRTGATEALGILYKELVYYHENIKNEYMELPQKSTNTARFRGASSTVEHICNMILKFAEKYKEENAK